MSSGDGDSHRRNTPPIRAVISSSTRTDAVVQYRDKGRSNDSPAPPRLSVWVCCNFSLNAVFWVARCRPMGRHSNRSAGVTRRGSGGAAESAREPLLAGHSQGTTGASHFRARAGADRSPTRPATKAIGNRLRGRAEGSAEDRGHPSAGETAVRRGGAHRQHPDRRIAALTVCGDVVHLTAADCRGPYWADRAMGPDADVHTRTVADRRRNSVTWPAAAIRSERTVDLHGRSGAIRVEAGRDTRAGRRAGDRSRRVCDGELVGPR